MKHTYRIGLGTAAIGRPQYINIRTQQNSTNFDLADFKKKGKSLLEEAYLKGIRYFDTAPGYGIAEQMLIEWLETKKDPSIEIATKWGYTYIANFDPNATIHEVKEHRLSKLNEQWTVSHQLLPYLSTYQIHSATLETGVLDNQAVLERLLSLKKDHQLKIGISTTGANQVEVIRKALATKVAGNELFDTFQVTFNILDQSLLEVLKMLQTSNKRIIVKEALANGRLFPNKNYPHYTPLYKLLIELSSKYGVGIDAIALRYCMDSLSPYQVLSGAANRNHLHQNLEATHIKLDQIDLQRLYAFRISPQDYWRERKQLTWN